MYVRKAGRLRCAMQKVQSNPSSKEAGQEQKGREFKVFLREEFEDRPAKGDPVSKLPTVSRS